MTLIDITKFGGIVKKLDPTQLPPENGLLSYYHQLFGRGGDSRLQDD